jgi:hypothetical protein
VLFITSPLLTHAEVAGVPWPATDGLGRRVPVAGEVAPPNAERFVGIFYFLWHERGMAPKSPHWDGPYDVAKIFAHDPEALKKPDSPLWGGIGVSHYWGEPLVGYYLSADPWVLRRHAYLLADAGVDTLIFDTTNARSYREVYMALCEVFRQVRFSGGQTPQISFMVNTRAGETAQEIYRDLYKPGLYSELWFRWKGKPLMICDPAEANPELRNFFTLRRAHWPFTLTNTPYAWHWEATYPQPYGYTDDPTEPEQVNVSVAQNLRARDGKVTNMSFGDARGRSFRDGRQQANKGAVNYGHNFQEQWGRASEVPAPFVMVTGWNEWIAGRWGELKGPIVFVDQFDQEFSRDIEPMNGGHGDNYYYQLVANVRRFKGVATIPAPSAPKRIRVGKGFAQWDSVSPEYSDHLGETAPRDFGGAGGLHYTNRTGVNDLAAFKVARDDKHLYFYGRTTSPIVTHSNTMWLFIDVDSDVTTGWEGFDYLVNRTRTADGLASVERHAGNWSWKTVGMAQIELKRNELQLSMRRSLLVPDAHSGRARLPRGVSEESLSFNFKWADNVRNPGDIMDFYLTGDVAPEGRFRYRYQTR